MRAIKYTANPINALKTAHCPYFITASPSIFDISAIPFNTSSTTFHKSIKGHIIINALAPDNVHPAINKNLCFPTKYIILIFSSLNICIPLFIYDNSLYFISKYLSTLKSFLCSKKTIIFPLYISFS